METRFLRSFVTVAELGTFSRAAEKLFVSQPALSRQIKGLEEALGAPLFERVGHGVIPTEAGTYLLDRARRLLREVEEIEKTIKNQAPGPVQTVTIGVAPVPARFVVPHLLRGVARHGPRVFVNVVTGASSHIEDWLAKGQLDVALMYDFLPRHGYEVRACAAEETWLFGRPELVKGEQATPQAIERMPMILPDRANLFRKNIERWMGTQGASLSTVCDVNDHTTLRGCLLEGIGLSVLARDAFDADIAAGTLKAVPLAPALERRLGIVTHVTGAKQDIVRAFADQVRQSVRAAIAAGAWSARELAC